MFLTLLLSAVSLSASAATIGSLFHQTSLLISTAKGKRLLRLPPTPSVTQLMARDITDLGLPSELASMMNSHRSINVEALEIKSAFWRFIDDAKKSKKCPIRRQDLNTFSEAKKRFRKSITAFISKITPSVDPFETLNAVQPDPNLLQQRASNLVTHSLALRSIIQRADIRHWNPKVSESVNQGYAELFKAAEKLSERRIVLLSTKLEAWVVSKSHETLTLLLPKLRRTMKRLYVSILGLRAAVTTGKALSPQSRNLRPAQLETMEITLVYMTIIIDHVLGELRLPEEVSRVWDAHENMFSEMMKLRTSSTRRQTAEECSERRCQVFREQIKVALRFFQFCDITID